MPNIQSAKKRVRQTARKTEVNKARRSRIRTFIKKVDNAIQEGEKSAAHSALEAMQSEIMRGVSRGIIKKNTAARKISRLSAQVRNLS